MAVPDFQSLMKPMLELLGSGKTMRTTELVEALAKRFNLTDEDRADTVKSGQRRFDSRVQWARTYLYQAGLIEFPSKGNAAINKLGIKVLKENPDAVNVKYLDRFPAFLDFKTRHRIKDIKQTETQAELETDTPAEILEKAYLEILESLAREMLIQVVNLSPSQFERLVVELLVKMGYGGSIQDAGQAIGRSGDEGIDGVIKEDKLGLDKIYIQAKKWDPQRRVGRSDVQAFVGALEGKGARKGVFITTASFTNEALQYKPTNSTMVKIDGSPLAYLLVVGNTLTTPFSFLLLVMNTLTAPFSYLLWVKNIGTAICKLLLYIVNFGPDKLLTRFFMVIPSCLYLDADQVGRSRSCFGLVFFGLFAFGSAIV